MRRMHLLKVNDPAALLAELDRLEVHTGLLHEPERTKDPADTAEPERAPLRGDQSGGAA